MCAPMLLFRARTAFFLNAFKTMTRISGLRIIWMCASLLFSNALRMHAFTMPTDQLDKKSKFMVGSG